MKKLLPIFLMAVFASCAAPKYYDCPKYVGIAIDTLPLSDSIHFDFKPVPLRYITIKPDTLPAMLQVSSNRPMRVVYGIPGYVVLNGDTTYLDRNKKALDPRFTVWNFKRRAK